MKDAPYTVFNNDDQVIGQVYAANKREAIGLAREKYGKKAHSVARVTQWQIKRSKG